MKLRNILSFFLILIFCIDCSNQNSARIEKSIKYREKNTVSSVSLDNVMGNLTICGWDEDFIEINTTKKLLFGLPGDLNLFDTVFFRDNSNELLILTKIPARLNASIDLTVYVPYTLSSITVNQEFGNIKILKYFGNIDLNSSAGNHNIDFLGETLRMNCRKSKIELNVSCCNFSDIVLLGDNCDFNVRIWNTAEKSYFDFNGNNSGISFYINEELSHSLFVKSSDRRIHLKYKPDNMKLFVKNTMAIMGTDGDNPENFVVDINADGGRVMLQKLKTSEVSHDFFSELRNRL